MTLEERNKILNEVDEMTSKIKDMLYNIVWENQEGQDDHFDKLPKSERVSLVGLLRDATTLCNNVSFHKSWFK